MNATRHIGSFACNFTAKASARTLCLSKVPRSCARIYTRRYCISSWTHVTVYPEYQKTNKAIPNSLTTNLQDRRSLAAGFVNATQFHRIADETLERLSDELNDITDAHAQGHEFDVDFGDAVLTLDLANHGTYVINKQTPNKQIWLSSPTSGPKRYDYDAQTNQWMYSHDDIPLHTRLSTELSEALGQSLIFEPPPVE